MNAGEVIRAADDRRQRNVFFEEETRRSGCERRRHGRTAAEAWAKAKAQWKRLFA